MAVDKSTVRAIKDTDLGDDDLDEAISTASTVRTEFLDSTSNSSGLNDTIEKHLAAHFASLKDPEFQKISNRGIGVDATVTGQTGMFLEATLHGQTAIMLDNSGTLKELQEEKLPAQLYAISELEDR